MTLTKGASAQGWGCWFGDAGEHVRVVVDGVKSNVIRRWTPTRVRARP